MPQPTETAEFWRDEWTVTPEEEITVQEYFLQQNRPLSVEQITRFLMEKSHLGHSTDRATSNGTYNPTALYEPGDRLTFPAPIGQVGEVRAIREGNNPRFGSFRVMEVFFAEQEGTREFAIELSNQNADRLEVVDAPPMEVDELIERFGELARDEVEAALEASDNFVQRGQMWLPRLMLVSFHDGHLNIVDAMIDIMGEPLTTAELLKEIPIEEESPEAIAGFSLDHQLSHDSRFVNQGQEMEPRWFLRRLV